MEDSLRWVTVVLGLCCSWHPCVVVAKSPVSPPAFNSCFRVPSLLSRAA